MDYSLFVIFVIILQPIDQIFALESSLAFSSTNTFTVDEATKHIPVYEAFRILLVCISNASQNTYEDYIHKCTLLVENSFIHEMG